MGDASEGLILLLGTFAILVVFFATLQFYAERTASYFNYSIHVWLYPDGQPTPYQSVPSILFDTILTLMGQPSVIPKSMLGKIVTATTIITFIFVVAFPLTMISISYSKVVNEQLQEKVLKREKKLRKRREKIMMNRELESKKYNEYCSNAGGSNNQLTGLSYNENNEFPHHLEKYDTVNFVTSDDFFNKKKEICVKEYCDNDKTSICNEVKAYSTLDVNYSIEEFFNIFNGNLREINLEVTYHSDHKGDSE
ncbi:hypothetical protein HDU92_000223, partial [Lobulomyces angularis]